MKATDQIKAWSGLFGKDYTNRNPKSLEELESLYKANYGITRTELNKKFLEELKHSIKILEVGCNVGSQLLCLQKMGFQNLYGVELQGYAVELAKRTTSGINIISGSAFDIPFKDWYFDLVFTSGVLIHISPKDINLALNEIYRVSNAYIWGFEYWAPKYTEINYRGYNDLLWKTDFGKKYQELFPNLTLIKEEKLKYLTSNNIDAMFLLKKV